MSGPDYLMAPAPTVLDHGARSPWIQKPQIIPLYYGATAWQEQATGAGVYYLRESLQAAGRAILFDPTDSTFQVLIEVCYENFGPNAPFKVLPPGVTVLFRPASFTQVMLRITPKIPGSTIFAGAFLGTLIVASDYVENTGGSNGSASVFVRDPSSQTWMYPIPYLLANAGAPGFAAFYQLIGPLDSTTLQLPNNAIYADITLTNLFPFTVYIANSGTQGVTTPLTSPLTLPTLINALPAGKSMTVRLSGLTNLANAPSLASRDIFYVYANQSGLDAGGSPFSDGLQVTSRVAYAR